MDFQNRAGSKKGGGGIASDSQINQQRRRQVEELLQQGENIKYTFQDNEGEKDDTATKKVQSNPYIYKNHSGKLVCKLCNTMHMSWSSVERHLGGKKHGMNVIRRGELDEIRHEKQQATKPVDTFEMKVEARRKTINTIEGLVPTCHSTEVIDEKGNKGIAVMLEFEESDKTADILNADRPYARIVSGLELNTSAQKDKRFLVVAYEPYQNVAIEIPNDREIVMNSYQPQSDEEIFVDTLNRQCTFWIENQRQFIVQIFFKETS
ncbi:Pre-mRNA-splicing factor SF3a complex subunit 2 (Prp11) [Nakaseomyces glabratus]